MVAMLSYWYAGCRAGISTFPATFVARERRNSSTPNRCIFQGLHHSPRLSATEQRRVSFFQNLGLGKKEQETTV